MSDTPKRIKPSDAASITPIKREAGQAIVQKIGEEIIEKQSINFFDFIYSGSDIEKIEPTKWQLKGKIVMHGLTAIYSEPGIGKSFVAIDMAICAVLNERWWGEYFPDNCKVLYIAAERYNEVADRIRAAMKKRGKPMKDIQNLHLLASPRPPQATETHLVHLIEMAEKLQPDIIIFDTFARMTLGVHENESHEVGQIVENYLRIVYAAGPQCSGLLVHHAGKDRTKGLRGSTALLGALDAVLRLDKEGDGLRLSVEKLNAAETPPPAYFKIASQEMPDPQDFGAMRSVGVLVSTDFSEVAQGIEGNLHKIFCEYFEDGASLAKIRTEYNSKHKPSGQDARAVSEGVIRKAIKTLIREGAVEKIGSARNTLYKPTAKALAAYKQENPD
jgi:hypothetical protein